jgi:hypothetical protein
MGCKSPIFPRSGKFERSIYPAITLHSFTKVAEDGRKRIDIGTKSGRQEENRELLESPKVFKIFKTTDSIIGGDRELRDLCEQASINAHVPQLIYDARTEVGMRGICQSYRNVVYCPGNCESKRSDLSSYLRHAPP